MGDLMGMTDNQFKAFRSTELEDYEDMLEVARIECKPDSRLLKMIERQIARAKADVER